MMIVYTFLTQQMRQDAHELPQQIVQVMERIKEHVNPMQNSDVLSLSNTIVQISIEIQQPVGIWGVV